MEHNYQKVAVGMTVLLMSAGAYLGSTGMLIPEEDDYVGAGVGAGFGFVAGLSFYAVTQIGINVMEKCLEWCGSDRGNQMRILNIENEALRTRLGFFSRSHLEKSSQKEYFSLSVEDAEEGQITLQKPTQTLNIQ